MRNDEAHRDDITIGEEATEQFVRPGLAVGRMVPEFRLESADGGVISPSDYKERKNLVIIFFNACDSRDLGVIAEVGRRYAEFADNNAEVLGIASGPISVFSECAKALRSPFPLLADVRSEAQCAYCVVGPMMFVADRYGELRMQSVIDKNLDTALDEALSTLELVEMECPECGVSTWPVE
jgi:peroxiredoxin